MREKMLKKTLTAVITSVQLFFGWCHKQLVSWNHRI